MANETLVSMPRSPRQGSGGAVEVLRHQHVCKKLQVSSAKLFAMCAEGVFPKPFKIIPGGRAVGWLRTDVDEWILRRHEAGDAR